MKLVSYQIKKLILKALKNLGLEVPVEEVFLEHPVEEKHGDYATNVAMKIFKNHESSIMNQGIKTPLELAEKIVEVVNSVIHNTKYIILDSVSAAPPGFINFFLSPKFFFEELKLILKDNLRYGMNQSLKGKKLMVEFAHPNTHKMFHIGHLRNIATGETIVRILEANGAKVIRANYQGDVGLHIAKALWALELKTQNSKLKIDDYKNKTIGEKMELLGKVYAQGSKAYEEDNQAKEEITEINAKIYHKDPEIFDLYKETRQWSLDYFEKIYKRVYSYFDHYYFESEVADLGKKIILENLANTKGGKGIPPGRWNSFAPGDRKGIFEKSDGAIIFDGKKYNLHKRVFINSEGFPTYEGKDVGLARLQFNEYQPDLIIHVVSPEQSGYFKVLFKALELLFPETKDKEYHLIYGWVRLKKGKMSSRLGNVVLGEWLIDELKKRLKEILKLKEQINEGNKGDKENEEDKGSGEEILEAAAIAAVKYSFLKVATLREIVFDIEESVNLQGDSGPYIQYTYARTQSVLEKNVAGSNEHIARGKEEYSSHTTYYQLHTTEFNLEELSILRTLYKFPEVVFCAGQKYQPNLICEFLYDLCQKYNLFYNKHRILNAETPELVNQRLVINEAVGIVLKNGLNLLGIKALSKM